MVKPHGAMLLPMSNPHQPIETLYYTLTRADALAWEAQPREMRGWRKALFLVWLGLAGVWLALLPPALVGDRGDWRFWALGAALAGLHWLIAAGVMTLATHLRAGRRVPHPLPVQLDIWGDHLTVRIGNRLAVFADELTAAATLTATHLFIIAPPEVLIVPLTVFDSRAAAAALVARIEAAGRDPA